ncbi:helix-turn-helix domain-containing protein [Nocardioides convexus]|nr:helix-turn-helix domain-containing protein [Nocardioides convexus]
MSVHPNTVDYRLRRVADLVGLDPWTADGLALLRAGLLGLEPAG